MTIGAAWERVRRFILRELWGLEAAGLPRARKLGVQAMRTLTLAVHGYLGDKCPLRAGGLTLVFVFSLAPALAVGFSVAKGFGVQERIAPAIYAQLGLIDEQGNPVQEAARLRELLDEFMKNVQETRFEALGIIGTALMLFAAYKILSAIDKTMNHIWGIRQKRKLLRRIVDYLAVVVVSPMMLMVTAVVTAFVRSGAALEYIGLGSHPLPAKMLGAFVSFLLAGIGFWFLYFFFPNTRVRFTSAATGAAVAAILWLALQSLLMGVQIGVRKYNAIYGAFAAFPIFVLWLNLAWQAILFGAELSYAHANHRDIEFGGLTFSPSPAYREHLALGAMTLAARAFTDEKEPLACEEMARRLAAPVRLMRELLTQLVTVGLLAELQGDRPRFQPAAPLDQINVGRVLDAVRRQGDESPQTLKRLKLLGVGSVLDRQEEVTRAYRNTTLLELARSDKKRERTPDATKPETKS